MDLNLLVMLRALLEERNVSHAAISLGVSQPTASAALRRLRRHYADELLLRVGGVYVLTPLAESLRNEVEDVLALAERALDTQPRFDPATTTRQFTVAMSEYSAAVFADQLCSAALAHANGVRLNLQQAPDWIPDDIDRVLRSVDLWMAPPQARTGHLVSRVLNDAFVCVVDRGNQVVGDHLTLDELEKQSWVTTAHGGISLDPMLDQLTRSGVDVHVEVGVDGFAAAARAVRGSQRVAFLPARLVQAQDFAGHLRTVSTDVETVALNLAMWSHRNGAHDPGIRWLRATVTAVAAALN